jgi:hypothetical protein
MLYISYYYDMYAGYEIGKDASKNISPEFMRGSTGRLPFSSRSDFIGNNPTFSIDVQD